MPPLSDPGTADVDLLFDAELRYEAGMPPFDEPDDSGQLVGSGIGNVAGPRVRGTVRWSNYERTSTDDCVLTLVGQIDADDGARIQFESRGFAVPANGHSWTVASAVRFVVKDPRYRWLESAPAMWTGTFDGSTATARYRAYAIAAMCGDGL